MAQPMQSQSLMNQLGRPGLLLVLSASFLFLGFAVAIWTSSPLVALMGWAGSLIAATVGIVVGCRWIIDGRRAGQPLATGNLLVLLGNALMTALGAGTALLVNSGFTRGRQLRRWGHVLLPDLRVGDSWARHPSFPDAWTGPRNNAHADRQPSGGFELAMPLAVPPQQRRGLAQQWRENARTEHASVAAFARLSLDLIALGAPPALIAAANRDALDEIRQAELCFSLARTIDGSAEGPGPFPDPRHLRNVSLLPPLRSVALAKLAVDSLIDGALAEGISARVVARLVKRTQQPGIAALLKEIAADEGRHSAHGWDVVHWCLLQGGRPIAHALLGAARAIPERVTSDGPSAALDGVWERWGIPGHALLAEEHAAARAQIQRRIEELAAPVALGLTRVQVLPAVRPTADRAA
jgi:hypothetical protein